MIIRNRISAQLSRDRKKAYLTNLKDQNFQLLHENKTLFNELKVLRENHQKFLDEKEELHKQFQPKNPNCPCSILLSLESCKYHHEIDDEGFFSNSISESGRSSRTLKKNASAGYINYSFILLAIFMFVCFLQNSNQDTQKGKIVNFGIVDWRILVNIYTPLHYYQYESSINHNKLEDSSVKSARFIK